MPPCSPGTGPGATTFSIYLGAALLCCLPVDRLWRHLPEGPRAWLESAGQAVLLLLVLTYVVSSTYNPFIYFNF